MGQIDFTTTGERTSSLFKVQVLFFAHLVTILKPEAARKVQSSKMVIQSVIIVR
jgi:hypothetical protein